MRLAISRSVCSPLSSSRLALRSCEARALCSSSALLTRRLHMSCWSTGHPVATKATVKRCDKDDALQMTPLGRVLPHALHCTLRYAQTTTSM